MMNFRLFLAILLFPTFNSLAQETQIPVNSKTGLAEYTEVISIGAADAGELYARTELWIKDFFSNPVGVIQKNDSAIIITGKHQFRLQMEDKKGNKNPSGSVTYNFSIEFKDGKYRYLIHNINQKAASAYDISKWEDKDDPNYNEERYAQYIAQTIIFFDAWIESLEEAMNTPIEIESSDW